MNDQRLDEIRAEHEAFGLSASHGGELLAEMDRLRSQLRFVDQAIDAWQDGGDPQDTLIAIRDQRAGVIPGDEVSGG